MKLSVEVSLYPLQEDYKTKIKDFLNEINSAGSAVEIRSSNMSTRLFGDFDDVTNLLNNAMNQSMAKYGKMVFVCKYLEGDARTLRGYD